MSLVYSNICSAFCNLPTLYASLTQMNLNPEIYALTETWFKDDVLFYLPGYTYCGIGSRKGGGVGFYYRNDQSILSIPENCLFCSDIECYVIKNTKTNVYYIIIYRPHSADIKKFFSYIEAVVSNVISKCKKNKIIIAGDFNIDLLKSTPCSNELLDILLSFNFNQTVFEQTRSSGRCIDNIFANYKPKVKVLDIDVSDHSVLYLSEPNNSISITRKLIRNISQKNLIKFASNVSEIDWSKLISIKDPNVAYDCFESIIKKHYDKCFNYISITNKQETWVTDEIKILLREKHRLQRIARRYPTSLNIKTYSEFRNSTNNSIRNIRGNFFGLKLKNCKNTKDKWNIMSNLMNRNRAPIAEIPIAPNKLNNFFTEPILANENSDYSLKINSPTTMALFPVTGTEILNMGQSINSNSAAGLDELHTKAMKSALPFLLIPITYLINLSFSTGIYPNKLKNTIIIPIHKKGDPSDCSNYRPISILSFMAKLFDKAYYNRLLSFAKKNNLISEHQFGFREKLGTTNAICKVYSQIMDYLDKSQVCIGIFLDLRKAFDSISHKGLIKKLSYLGIRGVASDWLSSYLSERTCVTRVNGILSDSRNLGNGTPQGSVLSPLLFNLFINDITEVISSGLTLYADDTFLLFGGYYLNNIIKEANIKLEKINKWLKNNNLALNLKKTVYIVFSNIGKNTEFLDHISVDNYCLSRVSSYKYLGIIFDQHLSWNVHIESLCSSLRQICGITYRIKNIIPHKYLKELYHAMFQSKLSYAFCIWGNTSNYNISRLSVLQKRIIRNINNAPFLAHTKELFLKNEILNVNQLYNYLCSIFLYKDYHGPKLIVRLSEKEVFTRSNNFFHLEQCKTSKKITSILYNGIKGLNSVLNNIDINEKDYQFKRKLKELLLRQ